MKEVLENLSIALGHDGEINDDVLTAARSMRRKNFHGVSMSYAEINAYALSRIAKENRQRPQGQKLKSIKS